MTPHLHLPATIVELERDLAYFAALAERLPKTEESRSIYVQAHVKTLQARIAVLESSQLAFEELGQVRQEGLGI